MDRQVIPQHDAQCRIGGRTGRQFGSGLTNVDIQLPGLRDVAHVVRAITALDTQRVFAGDRVSG